MKELRYSNQRGFGLLIILALLGVFIATAMVTVASGATSNAARMAETQRAMAAAKQALVAYAAGVPLAVSALDCPRADSNGNCARPGDLPCPDLNNDGWSDGPCFNPLAPVTTKLVGRLPWKTLGLPDLRDGDGERLWYAVSPSFVENPRTTPCNLPPNTNCLNSNSKGAITVRDNNAVLVNNGTLQSSAAIAVIIAPGAVITRLDKVAPQDRSCTGDTNVASCQATNVCSGTGAPVTYTNTALCNPVNYLDIMQAPVKSVVGAVANKEDNATFALNATTDGFINGPILDASGVVRLNDLIVPVTLADVMVPIQQRVAQEVLGCLRNYAGNAGGTYGNGRYPWAVDASTTFPTTGYFTDKSGTYFGHVPDSTQLSNTRIDSGSTMSASWPATCTLGFYNTSWWMNWKDLVFYGVASDYAPSSSPAPSSCASAACLTVNPFPTTKQVVVIVAGPPISGQTRSANCNTIPAPCNTPSNYLEGTNVTAWSTNASGSTSTYQGGVATTSFDDLAVYQ